MKLNPIATVTGLLAAALMPLTAGARTPKSTTPEMNSPVALTSEADGLLKAMQAEASEVRDTAETLMRTQVGSESHVEYVNDMRAKVNDMGQKLLRLKEISGNLPDSEQSAIARATPAVIEMANYTREAVKFLDEQRNSLFLPAYTNQIRYLADKAGSLATLLRDYEKYEKASSTEAKYANEFGLKKS